MNSGKRSIGPVRCAALLFMLLAAAMASGGALAQQDAGRFLVAVGTVVVERGAERIAAAGGTQVRAGDTIQVGPQSNAQIRLADESIVALRADTTFRISAFNFTGQEREKDSALFSLLKGGMRTVTGLIGKANQDAYRVDTPTSTIGIRGTHYTLRVCNDDCVEITTTAQAPIHLAAADSPVSDAGPLAQAGPGRSSVPNGTYGAVTDGRISVTNQSGAREFGADQYFHVASANAPAQQLIGPPTFLRDRLEGRGRTSQRPAPGSPQQAAESGTTAAASGSESVPTVAPTGQGGGTGDSRVSSDVSSPAISAPIAPTLTQVTNQVSTSGAATLLQATGGSLNNFYRLAGAVNIPIQCSGPGCSVLSLVDMIVGVNPVTQTMRYTLYLQLNDGGILTFTSGFRNDIPLTLSGGQLVFSSSDNAANYPFNQGSFRCNDCGPGNGPGSMQTVGVSGSITGGQVQLTVNVVDPTGGAGTFTVTLPSATPPNTLAAALAGPGASGGAQWFLQVNAAGQPVYVGEPLGIAYNNAAGTATIQTLGSEASLGNLSWGTWSGQSTGVNGNFQAFTLGPSAVVPWITGSIPNSVPTSLGSSVSYTPVGWLVGNGVGVGGSLNSATLTANFVSRNLALNINATNLPGPTGATYQLNGSAPFSTINGRFGAGFSSMACTGNCPVAGLSGAFQGFLSGPNAEGAGVSFSGGPTTTQGVVGVVGFKR